MNRIVTEREVLQPFEDNDECHEWLYEIWQHETTNRKGMYLEDVQTPPTRFTIPEDYPDSQLPFLCQETVAETETRKSNFQATYTSVRSLVGAVESMFIATRRPHLCDVCITSLVYRVYRLVIYTSRLSSYSLTALGSVVLIQQAL